MVTKYSFYYDCPTEKNLRTVDTSKGSNFNMNSRRAYGINKNMRGYIDSERRRLCGQMTCKKSTADGGQLRLSSRYHNHRRKSPWAKVPIFYKLSWIRQKSWQNPQKPAAIHTKRQIELFSEVLKLFFQSSTDTPALPAVSLPCRQGKLGELKNQQFR